MQTPLVTTTAVRWPAFATGGVTVEGEGLWLRPRAAAAVARIIVLPDADQPPEHVAGCLHGTDPQDHYALRLAEAGFEVLVVSLIDRQDTFAGSDAVQSTVGGATEGTFSPSYTNQPHREWLHRAGFQMVRHRESSWQLIVLQLVTLHLSLACLRAGPSHYWVRSPEGDRSSRGVFYSRAERGRSIATTVADRRVWIWRGRLDSDALCRAGTTNPLHGCLRIFSRAPRPAGKRTAVPKRYVQVISRCMPVVRNSSVVCRLRSWVRSVWGSVSLR